MEQASVPVDSEEGSEHPTPGIGHNQGAQAVGSSWALFCWKKAHKEAWKTPPMEIVRRRCEMAEAVGLDYRRFTAVVLDRGRYLSVVFFDLGDTLLRTWKGEIFVDESGEVELLPNVRTKLRRLLCPVFVVSNQSGVAFGKLSAEKAISFITQINDQTDTAIDDYQMCFHAPAAGCDCRKPRPGMVQSLLQRQGKAASNAFLVGDSDKDLKCAAAAKLSAFFWPWDYFPS